MKVVALFSGRGSRKCQVETNRTVPSRKIAVAKIFTATLLLMMIQQVSFGQANKIYWTDFGLTKIQRADIDGSNVEDLLSSLTIQPFEIDVDDVNGKLYWTETLLARIQRSDLDGSKVETIVSTGIVTPRGLALDAVNGKVYWTDWGTFKIQRCDLDGSNVEDLLTFGITSVPRGIVLDVAGGKMYWTDAGLKMIRRANLDGTSVEDLITTGLNTTVGIDLDTVAGKLYWTDLLTATIHRANLDGSSAETVVSTGLLNPSYIEVDATLGKLFWTDFGTTWVQTSNLDGSSVQNVVTAGLTIPTGIALSSSAALPVELTSFEAIQDNDDVILKWTTASETNSAGFDVQFEEGSSWITDSFVAGAGTTSRSTSYEYRVSNVRTGKNRFRLRQVDVDGTYDYSSVVEVFVDLPGKVFVTEAYPNPFSSSATMSLGVSTSQFVRVVMYDISGREVAVPFAGHLEADRVVDIQIDSRGLPAGVYMIHVDGESVKETRRVVLVR